MVSKFEGPFWLVEAKPGETAPSLSGDSTAERGYRVVYSDKEPEPAKDGLPTIWVQGKPQDAIPVIPTRPAFHPATRTVIIPEVAGVQYWLDGKEVQPGPVKVPGEAFTIHCERYRSTRLRSYRKVRVDSGYRLCGGP